MLAGLAAIMLANGAPAAREANVVDRAASAASSIPFDTLITRSKASMLANPHDALDLAREAEAVAARQAVGRERIIRIATARWLQGEALVRLNDTEHAGKIIDAATRDVSRYEPNSKLLGDLLMARGGIASVLGRVQDALRDFQQAYSIFRRIKDPRGQAVALQNIGMIYNDANDYPRVLQYYAQSAEIYPNDPALALSSHNNSANALRDLGRFREAEAEYNRALLSARQLQSPLLEARILGNIAWTNLLDDQFAAAKQNIAQGLKIAERDEAAGWRPILLGIAARLELKQGRPHEAVRLLTRAFAGVDLATTTMPFRDLHDTAYQAYKAVGDDRHALEHLEAFKRLDNESRNVVASTNAALMAARFDFANQDLKIAKLKAGQLERDVKLSRTEARTNLIIFASLLTIAFVVVSLLTVNIRSVRRSRNTIRAANDNLTLANEALEKALLAKTQFLATTSHEIRTPLNGILGMTQVILADRSVAPPLREKVQLVHGAGETMRALVDDILDLAKMETGNLVVNPAEMDLRRVLRETVEFWRGQATAKGLEIGLDIADCPERICEDETRLRQILFNLMANAIKFTPAGSVMLRATTATSPGPHGGERLRIRVEDSGIGIPADKFGDIFEKFHQLDGGTTRQFGGTGLGLSICRNLANAMGGDIGVESEMGVGSAFTVDLPLARVAGAERAGDRRGQGRASRLAESVLLLAETNLLSQSVLRAVLGPAVAEVRIAANGDAATAALRDGTIDILLIDGGNIQSDTANGLARLRELAGEAAAAGARVAILWTAPDAEDIARLKACGIDQVIAKPVSGEALLRGLGALHANDGDIAPSASENIAGHVKPAA